MEEAKDDSTGQINCPHNKDLTSSKPLSKPPQKKMTREDTQKLCSDATSEPSKEIHKNPKIVIAFGIRHRLLL